ncbi:MAG: hypothetical protein ACYSUM_19060 [Planctomycetota bacterium]
MGLFNGKKMKRAEALAVQIGENLLQQCLLGGGAKRSQAELVRDLALRVCRTNDAWSVTPEGFVRQGRGGAAFTPFRELRSALDLLAIVVDADLREHARLPERDHEEVMLRALQRLSLVIQRHSLTEATRSLAAEMDDEKEVLRETDDPEEVESAHAAVARVAESVLSASYGACAFADFLDEQRIRPLTALRLLAARDPAWTLDHGELRYWEFPIGTYANEDPLNSIFMDMVSALLMVDYPHLSERAHQELTLAAMSVWDRGLAELFLERTGADAAA